MHLTRVQVALIGVLRGCVLRRVPHMPSEHVVQEHHTMLGRFEWTFLVPMNHCVFARVLLV